MLGKNIGEGTFGKVKAGTHNITGEKVSVVALISLLLSHFWCKLAILKTHKSVL